MHVSIYNYRKHDRKVWYTVLVFKFMSLVDNTSLQIGLPTVVDSCVLVCVTSRYVESGVVEYLESAEKLWIFRRCYIVGILTNKRPTLEFSITFLWPFHWLQNTWPWITQNGYFALNSVLRRYVWSSEVWSLAFEAWLGGYSWTCSECCRRWTLNWKEQLRHRAVSLRQHRFLVLYSHYTSSQVKSSQCEWRTQAHMCLYARIFIHTKYVNQN